MMMMLLLLLLMMMMVIMIRMVFQTYSKEAIDQAQEALTVAQKTRHLPNNIFEVQYVSYSLKTVSQLR